MMIQKYGMIFFSVVLCGGILFSLAAQSAENPDPPLLQDSRKIQPSEKFRVREPNCHEVSRVTGNSYCGPSDNGGRSYFQMVRIPGKRCSEPAEGADFISVGDGEWLRDYLDAVPRAGRTIAQYCSQIIPAVDPIVCNDNELRTVTETVCD